MLNRKVLASAALHLPYLRYEKQNTVLTCGFNDRRQCWRTITGDDYLHDNERALTRRSA